MSSSAWIEGGCHCGRIRFRVEGPITGVTDCNCSICTKKGFLHWIVPLARFQLLAGEDDLRTYRFNTGVAKHTFCSTCGIHGFYVPRSDPDKVDVNVRCLDGVDPRQIDVAPFDGQNWERSMAGPVPWRAAPGAGFVLVAVLGVRPAARADFEAYERQATAIMRTYGGTIARTIAVAPRAADDFLMKEIHVVTFPDEAAFAAYRADPRLAAAAPQRDAAIASTQIFIGTDGPSYG